MSFQLLASRIGLFATLSLSACASSSSDQGNPPIIFADGTPLVGTNFDSYIGRSIPFRTIVGTDQDGGADVRIVKGTVRAVDAGSVEFSFESGAPPEVYQYDSAIGAFVNSEGYQLRVVTDGYNMLFYTKPGFFSQTLLVGNFGFQTPESRYPSDVARYNEQTASALFIATEGDDIFDAIFAGEVDLTVDFGKSTVAGTLMDGTTLVDFDNEGVNDDALSVFIQMSGTLGANGVRGTFTGVASADLEADGIDPIDLNLDVTNSSVDGALYGNDAERLIGTYSGRFEYDDPSAGAVTGEAVGYFDAAR